MNSKDEFYDYLCQDIDVTSIDMIGISAPGIINEDSIVLSKAADTVKIMFQTNINQEVFKRLHKPVFAMKDAKAAGLCELQLGNSKDSQISAYFIIGTGVGGCVYNGNTPLYGINHVAGELSFLPFTMKDDHIVSLSHYASMSALIELYNQKVSKENHLYYGLDVCKLYLDNNLQAIEAMEK